MKLHSQNLTDQQILELVSLGDATAFHELYKRHKNKVITFAYRFVKDEEEAKDLTQDVFIKFWENKENIDIDRTPDALLFVMVRNKFLDALRRKAHQHAFLKSHNVPEPLSHSTDDYMDFKDSNKIFSLAIHTLPKQAKAAYLLSRESGLTHSEIAEHLKISKKTVNNQITNSIAIIRNYFRLKSPDTVIVWIFLINLLFRLV